MAETWFDAFERLMARSLQMAQEGQTISGVREMMRMWTEVADDVFTEMFGSDLYIETQSRMVNASMAYRVAQRRIMETVLAAYDMPTRKEVDEAHRRIYELRREVRELKRQVEQLSQPAPRKRTPKAKQG
jgi:class III poly(R)-hydroxyalkanoic acid synthase PhaE subunit